MKYKFILFLFLFFSFQITFAQSNLKKQIGDTLTSYANKDMWVGKVTVRNLYINSKRKQITVTTNEPLGYLPFREENVKQIYGAIRAVLPAEYKNYQLHCLVDRNRIENLIPNYFRKENKDYSRQYRIIQETNPLIKNLSLPYEITRGLNNKHIALWPSHGYYYNQETARWEWQRPRLYQTVEDLFTESFVLPFLIPMLENAGGTVIVPRERDMQTQEIIIDNDYFPSGSFYVESDNKFHWKTGDEPGFAHAREFYIHGENPFKTGTYRYCNSINNCDKISTIEWLPKFPSNGSYAVYVSYKTLDNSASDAIYTVYHAGGETSFQVNQTMYGSTWLYLGNFDFKQGCSNQGKVTLSNYSEEEGKVITADAVRFGGGMGNIARQPYVVDSVAMLMRGTLNKKDLHIDSIIRQPSPYYTQETSGYPRFMEGSRYWLQWAGAPDSVYSRTRGENDYSDDFQSRGFWVNYIAGGSVVAPDEGGLRVPVDMALGFHTDAGVTPNDSTIGTLAIFTTRNNDKKYQYMNGTSRMSSRDLADLVQSQIVEDIRTLYNAEWSSRGIWDKSFSESRVPEVPTMLLELLSHQNFADMRFGLDPRFRFNVCRAVYKGILKYFESVYDQDYIIQPLPVHQFSAVLTDNNQVNLQWLPTADTLEPEAVAENYIVYMKTDDEGFDNGTLVHTNKHTVNIEPDKIYSFKVVAQNAGGISFPSEELSVCRSPANKGEVLIINGFDRISAPSSFMQDTVRAGFMNDEDAGVPYMSDVSFVGNQHEFKRDAPFLSNDAPGVGASYGQYEKTIVTGNTFNYPYIHGKAIREAGFSFTSCSKEAVLNGDISLNNYSIIDLILGKQRKTLTGKGEISTEFQTFPLALQKAIEAYTRNGGNLLVSGAYFASDLEQSVDSTQNGKQFLEKTLRCKLLTAKAVLNSQVRTVKNPLITIDNSSFAYYNLPNSVSYYIESPDAIEPTDKKGHTFCRYEENNLSAGVISDNSLYRVCALAFPFETIQEEKEQYKLMNSILLFLSAATK